MNLNNVKKIIELAKNEKVSELKYEDKEMKISVSFSTGVALQSAMALPVAISTQTTGAASSSLESKNDENFHIITSPFVGTFYSSSAPDKPNFVKVGDRVSVGQTLCILEAMKIMNEIESDVNGEIVEICADNESLIEFGQSIFKIRK